MLVLREVYIPINFAYVFIISTFDGNHLRKLSRLQEKK